MRECANTYCERRVRPTDRNKFGVCHACIVIVNAVKWLLEAGVLSEAPKQENPLNIWTPNES